MPIGDLSRPPIGHLGFCQDHPSECVKPAPLRSLSEPLQPLSTSIIVAIAALNTRVNGAIVARSDQELYGVEEHWAFPASGYGDCEDYVLEKRRELMAMGVDAANLLITVVKKLDGTGHAVLTLRSDQGDFILDNLDWRIRPWRETSYRYIKRQSSTDPAQWRLVETYGDPLVSSVGR
ncbi:MAG: transglutaminase-like cysteine peptidase [Pseudomonadota bacterium]|nr:transglutaminase-like cysteine peptidase [Pseudomonadota bacterium]